MRLRLFTIVLSVLCASLSLNAQILWKISGNGLEKPSYLLGTLHFSSIGILDSIKGFQDAFESCGQIVGELDMDEMMANMSEITKQMLLPQDSLLDVILSTENYTKLDVFLKKEVGVGAEQMKMLKPVGLLTQLTVLAVAKGGYRIDLSQPMDMMIQRIAKEKGKAVKGLETMAFQADLLFGQPLDEQCKDLMKVVADFDQFQKFSVKMYEDYQAGRLEELTALMNDKEFGMDELMVEKLVHKRNRNWVEQMITFLPVMPNFFVVGAGHLNGDQGLIKLLQHKGYTMTSVD